MKTVKYYSRSKERELIEIETAIGFKLKKSDASKRSSYGAPFFDQTREDMPQINADDLNAFAKSGWIFVKRGEANQAPNERSLSSDIEEFGAVYLDRKGKVKISTNKLIIQFAEKLDEEEIVDILSSHNLTIVQAFKFAPNLFQVQTSSSLEDIIALSNTLTNINEVISSEPEFIEHIPSRLTPNDPDYSDQWQWNNDGSATTCESAGTANADIRAEDAWDISRGQNITIAIIDNGFDINHLDLRPALTTQSGFFQLNGAGPATFNQSTPNTFPDSDHGTFCAGMALARADNSLDGCGAANQANFTAIACLVDQVGSQVTLARAIAYAADPRTEVADDNRFNGADIISCSLGPNGADWEMTNVLEAAINFSVSSGGRAGLGASIFWAVTNGNFTIDGADGTDEVVSNPNVIAVGRSTNTDEHDNSGFGPELDFLAPGVNVLSTTSGGGTRCWTGTSFAAPCAAGVGALALSIAPQLHWRQLRDLLRNSCDQVGEVDYGTDNHHPRYGYGRINALSAVQQASTFNYDDNQQVTVLRESSTGLNRIFRDNTNGRVFTRLEFVQLINEGRYPAYEVIQMGRLSVPRSKADSTVENNLG